jgi:hypothetical protein
LGDNISLGVGIHYMGTVIRKVYDLPDGIVDLNGNAIPITVQPNINKFFN